MPLREDRIQAGPTGHPRAGRADSVRRPERRRGPRTPIAYVRCWSPTPGAILDVSRRGVGIESFRPFQVGHSIFLVSELVGRGHRILGHVRWCRQIATAGGSSSPVFQIGIALAKPLEERWLSALLKAGLNGSAAQSGSATTPGTGPAI